MGQGEYNPANTRVLHFVHNPEAEARQEHEAARISELEAESATLRAQLQALQPKEAGVEPKSMAAAVAAAEKSVLERKVTSPHQCTQLKVLLNTGSGRRLSSVSGTADLSTSARACSL